MAMARNVVETIVGAVVLVVAVGFTTYAFTHSGSGRVAGYDVVARFDRADGIKRGGDVTLAGVKIGTVTSVELDPKSFWAVAHLTIDDSVKLPADSFVKIVSESLLGGSVILVEPGSESESMKPGGEFKKSQGARSLIELLIAAVAPSVNRDSPKN